jgi:hypothetical protein
MSRTQDIIMTKTSNLNLIIPKSIDQKRHAVEFLPSEICIFIPIPDGELGEGIYVNQSDIVALLRANSHSPEAIRYIADMME